MFNFRQGYKAFKVQIWENETPLLKSDGSVYEYNFPKTNAGGMKEYHTPDMLIKKDIGRNKKPKLFGLDSKYVADYSRYTPPIVLDNLTEMVDFFIQGKQWILLPRLDTLARTVKVFPSERTLEIGIMRGGANAPGNKGIILEFICINLITTLPVFNPNDLNHGGKY